MNKKSEGKSTMGLLNNILKNLVKTPQSSTINNTPIKRQNPHIAEIKSSDLENHKVAGVTNYMDAIMSFGKENPEYSFNKKQILAANLQNTKLYQYEFRSGKTELIPEPTNPYDPKAIKVLIDGKLVGYIKSGSCSHVLKLINENQIERITSEIKGGNHKILFVDGNYSTLDKTELNIGIQVTIYKHQKKAE